MPESAHPIAELLRRDRRYPVEAYMFVFESLKYAQDVMGLGSEQVSEPLGEKAAKMCVEEQPESDTPSRDDVEQRERHLTGQELCEAIRRYALEQYGYMAKCVLNQWGVHNTSDFGEIVFNLIEIGQMRKTNQDRREDFNSVFDFDVGLQQRFQFRVPE
jgi:uncharacterized repeat protein (TIGR04138 family)